MRYLGTLPYIPKHLDFEQYKVDVVARLVEMCWPKYVWFVGPEDSVVSTTMNYINLILSIASLLAMAASMATYFLFPDLQNMPHKIRLNFTAALFTFHLSFLAGMRRSVMESETACKSVSIALHYQALATFCWSSIIAYELYSAFGSVKGLCTNNFSSISNGAGRRLRYYYYVGYGVPLVIVSIAVTLNFTRANQSFDVAYGKYGCWIADGLPSGIFFGLPLCITLFTNIFLYTLTVRSIRQTGDSVRDKKHHNSTLNEVKLYARMSAALGFTWILGLLSVVINATKNHVAATVFIFLFVVLNASQGLMIFIAFTWNDSVKEHVKNLMKTGKRTLEKRRCFDANVNKGSSGASDGTLSPVASNKS